MKNVLFVIDMQNDFCLPVAPLYVPGAELDVQRTAAFLKKYSGKTDHIILTQDSHQVLNIAHPCFWRNESGDMPQPFTNITYQDVKQGVWYSVIEREYVLKYLKNLEEQGEYAHTVWPEHCLEGSRGAAIVDLLLNEVAVWAREGKFYSLVKKGTNSLTEHFGALRANIPLENAPETQLNQKLIQKLNEFDNILIAGEAKSHCVANTIKQMLDFPELIAKVIILEDCMSAVAGCGLLGESIFKSAQTLGAQRIKSTEFSL